MSTVGQGGAVILYIRCKQCGKELRFTSDNGTDIKSKVVASCHVAGIDYAKYHRWGSSLGRNYIMNLGLALSSPIGIFHSKCIRNRDKEAVRRFVLGIVHHLYWCYCCLFFCCYCCCCCCCCCFCCRCSASEIFLSC